MTIAGQNINELTAKTDYANNQVTFDATARQPERTMSGAGSLVLHPDHQEVHLQRLSLETQGMTWQTAPGVRGDDSVRQRHRNGEQLHADEWRPADFRRRHLRASG